MCDIFTRQDAMSLLQGKYILMLGDSNMRALYKDLIWLLETNTLIESHQLRTKMEKSFLGDKRTAGDKLHKARNFTETRVYENHNVRVKYSFLTKCYSEEVKNMLGAIKSGASYCPDVVVVNSCLWDISRWGPNGVPEYKDNMVKLMRLFKSCLPKQTCVIWMTTLPISASCRGGFLIKQVEFLRHTMRFEVMEANMYARDVVASFGFDVLDVHYYMRMQIHRRSSDGVHWLPSAMRHITNILLTHIALVWNRTLPGNFSSLALEKAKVLTVKEKKHEFKLPEVPNIFIREKQSGPPECCRLRARAPLKDCATRRRRAARTQFEEHAQRSNWPAQLQFIQHSDTAAVDPELNSWNMAEGLKYHV
ncbi:PC-esterase domain-containing protein 1A-like isoform X2 [Schistocerca gregaria]|uniref:PC-esterase domain-containing protein 1A-like isoform X2 n=1 Tax=Schistocerca gregaria TaxID=7010 RepID=UPI00211ECD8E|nr:PC-esterase domain-containing protein 1A-like isoform X2 [Schistocerca gregaria]